MTGLDRLRELADDMSVQSLCCALLDGKQEHWNAQCWAGMTVNGMLRAIAGQIEAEQEERVTRRVEDREGAEWVREHGGIAYVKDAWSYRSNLARQLETAKAKVGRQQRHIEAVQGKCRERKERICELNRLNRAYRDALNGVCKRLGLTDGTGLPDMPEVIWTELDRRLMPEGMEWPRYESGDLVMFGDCVENRNGTCTVNSVRFYSGGGVTVYGEGRGAQFVVVTEPVMRDPIRKANPKVLAADGEPLEVGQTVWADFIGDKHCRVVRVSGENSVCIRDYDGDGEYTELMCNASDLTHQRPVLDADGNRIEPAMDVWWICEGDERGVHAERLHVESIGEDGLVTCDPFNGGTWVELEPSELYVRKPALDADGVPIKVGDRMWNVAGGGPYKITRVNAEYAEFTYNDNCGTMNWGASPKELTHKDPLAKPEPPDSWERVEEDAEKDPCGYFGFDGEETCDKCPASGKTCEQTMALDLVRRAKALAERGE